MPGGAIDLAVAILPEELQFVDLHPGLTLYRPPTSGSASPGGEETARCSPATGHADLPAVEDAARVPAPAAAESWREDHLYAKAATIYGGTGNDDYYVESGTSIVELAGEG